MKIASLVAGVRCYFLIFILSFLSFVFLFIMPASATDTVVQVEPQNATPLKGDVFKVNVTLSNVLNMSGWEFKLYWNETIINCTQAEIVGPSEWNSLNFTWGPGLQNDYNGTHSRYWRGFTLQNPAPSFNGSTPLVTLTFKALKTGATTLDLVDVLLADSQLLPRPIIHTDYDGSVTVLPLPLYMRSDKHTVNNATMYKLIETHSSNWNVTSKSALDPEDEWVGYWGVRVWKRSSNGTESEITSGSPVAVVSRPSSGQGLQSANWTCPATNLSINDSLVVRVYYKFDVDSYTLSAEFSTVQLNATSLTGQTWTVYYYTQRSYNSQQHKTYLYYYWDNTYPSRIENLDYR
jgi:hypothetical protein